ALTPCVEPEDSPPDQSHASVTGHDPASRQRPGRTQFQIESGLSQEASGFMRRRQSRSQAGWLTFLPAVAAAAGALFLPRIRSDPHRIVHCATDSSKDSYTATHCSSSRSLDGGQLGRLRTIIVVVDQLTWAALQATISPYTRSGSSKGSMASTLTSAFKASAATTWVYSPLTANRLTIESFSLPVRLSATTSLCAWV